MGPEGMFALFIQWIVAVWNSTFFSVIKFLLGVYAVVLFLDIILLLILRGTATDITKTFYGTDLPPAHRGKTMKRWKKLTERFESELVSQWKVAVLEADAVVDEVLEKANLSGENMRERLEKSLSVQVENRDRLLWAHDIRNKIIQDETFVLEKDTAREVVEVFEEFLKSWEAL